MKKLIIFFISIILFTSLNIFATVNIQTNNGFNYTGILVNGSTTNKYDIVFIGDGFTVNQQDSFNNVVNQAIESLRNLAPYKDLMCSFNIWRVNVVSTESGIDHPVSNIFRNTELDCRYGDTSRREAERCITTNSPGKCLEAAGYAPGADAIFVLCNDAQYGGCSGSIVFSSISPGFAGTVTHELGHKIGLLADEYTCYVCNGSDNNRAYTGTEPDAVNLTINTNRATIKWRNFIDSTTPLPTTVDSPLGVVGLWAGGGYYGTGIFHPQKNCQMRNGAAFCKVCFAEMNKMLRSHCSSCEIDPNSLACIIGHRLKDFRKYVMLDIENLIRLRIPRCLSCPYPSDSGDLVKIILEGVDSKNFDVQLTDETGKVSAEIKKLDNRAEIQFTQKADHNYFLELKPLAKETPGKQLSISAKMFVNNKQTSLY